MAESLVSSMSGDFEPENYTDEYRAALQQVIDAKVEGREVVEAAAPKTTSSNVVDLMAALRASVDAAKRGDVGASDGDGRHAEATSAQKATTSGTSTRARAASKQAAKASKASGTSRATKAPAKATKSANAASGKAAAKRAPAKTARPAAKTAARRRTA